MRTAVSGNMAHDANFVGNRLRLSAFLSCVRGMPDRPSRFRPPIQDLDVADSAAPFSGLHRDVSVREPGREPAILPSESSAEAEVIRTNLCQEAATTDRLLDTNIEEDRSVLDGLTNAPSVYDIPRSPPPDLRLASGSGSRQGLRNGLSSTRKRRLPAHELALLRTTTLDGLPLPGVRSFHGFHRGQLTLLNLGCYSRRRCSHCGRRPYRR